MTITIFKNATLIDGNGNKPIERGIVAIEDDKIIYAGISEKWIQPPEKTVNEMDMMGKYILPGLIDCHVHIAAECLPDSTMTGPWGWTSLIMLKHAQNTLAAGITTIRDVGGRHHLEFSLRKAVEAGREAYLAGRMTKKLYSASPSSPTDGVIAHSDTVTKKISSR